MNRLHFQHIWLRSFFVLILLIEGSSDLWSCPLRAMVFTGACDSGMKTCDPEDDLAFFLVQVEPMLGLDDWIVKVDGNEFGPYPANGQVQLVDVFKPELNGRKCFLIEKFDDPTCFVEVCLDSIFPCFVRPSIKYWDAVCNDNRTANDVTDDFYTVTLSANIPDIWWRYEFFLDIGGASFGPYAYNEIINIRLPADGSQPTIYLQDEFDLMCEAWLDIPIPLDPCSVPCAQFPSLISEVCLDKGSPDPNDDVWQIEVLSTAVTAGKTGAYVIRGPLIPPTPMRYNVVNRLFIPARGQTIDYIFSDIDYDDCNEELEIGPLDPCSEFCEVDLDSIAWTCDDNGTPNPADDFYRVVVVVSGKAAGTGYNVQIGGNGYGPFDYDSTEVLILPADGSMPRLNFRDIQFASQCNTFEIIGPLEPCSFPCEISFDKIEAICDDNGTSDPNDDSYTINFHVLNPLGGMGDMYEFIINGNTNGPFTYAQDHSIPWPADGNTYPIIVRDVGLGAGCEIYDTLGPLIPCSSDCILDIQVSNITCDNEGTGTDNSDDTYSFTLTVNGQNVGSQWEANDPLTTTRNYGGNATFGNYPISGGSVTLVISDTQDQFCRETITVDPPSPCSDSCALEIISIEEGPCDDNNTGPDRTDDFFFVELIIDGINTSVTGQYGAFINGVRLGTYSYGNVEIVGPIPANGNVVTLVLRDEDFGYCEVSVNLRKDPCSDCDMNTADAGQDAVITCASNSVVLNGSAPNPGSFEWTGPTGRTFNGPTPTVGEPGVYILVVTFDKQCTATDTVVVTRDQNLPIADPGLDMDLTCKVDTVTLGGNGTSSGINIVYEWTNAQGQVVSTDQFYTTWVPGVYCFRAIDTLLDCPSASNCVEVGVNRKAPNGRILVNPEDAFDCRIDSISLTAESGDSTNYYWESGAVTFFLDTLWVTDTGMVYLILEDTINGCTTKLDINIKSLVDFPIISIQKPEDITCLREEVEIDGSFSQAGPGIMYQWFTFNNIPIPGANSRTLRVTQPGNYILESVDDVTGCLNRDTIAVNEDRLFHVANAGEDEVIKCDSASIILDASGSTQQNNISYSWNRISGTGNIVSGNGTLFPEIDGKGFFELQVRDEVTGCISMDTVFVDRAFAPILDQLIVQNEKCGGDENGLIDIRGIRGIRPFTYELNGRDVDTTRFEDLKPGLFFFRITDSLGCFTDTLVEVNEGNYFDFRIQGDTFIIKGDSTTLSVDINIPTSEVDQVYWEEDGSVFCFRCYSVTVKPDTTTTYDFRLIDVNGCEYEFSFVVRVQEENDIYVPNIFTPNGDTDNELMQVFGKNLENIDNMMIFNRWGELVFQGTNLAPGPVWDGTWNGNKHVPAVLTYMIDARFKDGSVKRFTGAITLLW